MPAPVNDDLGNATPVSGASGSVGPVTIDEATTQGGELGSSNQTIWYVFHATADATGLHFTTEGSAAGDVDSGDGITPPSPFGSLDTNLHVYESTTPAPSFGSLSGHTIASNDDAPSGGGAFWSEVTFDVLADHWYFIQIGTFDPTYTGTVVLNWDNVPAPADLTIQFISEESGCQYVSRDAGHAIPLIMPTGIEAGDYLVANMGNILFDVVSPFGLGSPSGWAQYNENQWVKVADGSESGATVNWTSQNTHALDGDFRTLCWIVACYRFSTPPTQIFAQTAFNFSDFGGSASSGPIGLGVDGLSTQFRVFLVVGSSSEQGPGSFLGNNNPITDVLWTNISDRAGVLQQDWWGSGGIFPADDSDGVAMGDVIHSNPTGSSFDPGDEVTILGPGPYATGGYWREVFFYWPQIITLAYWGINATTPA